jgi:hypothetical protein
MKHLLPIQSLFEIERYPSSPWPKRKVYSGVKITEILDEENPEDLERIKEYMKSAYQRNKWFSGYFDANGVFNGNIPFNVTFVEMALPDGKIEIIPFEQDEYEGEWLWTGSTLDQKWDFWFPAKSGENEPDFGELEFMRNKKF